MTVIGLMASHGPIRVRRVDLRPASQHQSLDLITVLLIHLARWELLQGRDQHLVRCQHLNSRPFKDLKLLQGALRITQATILDLALALQLSRKRDLSQP